MKQIDYHNDKTRQSRSSLADLYFESPAFYQWKHFSGEYDESDTAATRFGSILHSALFEPNIFPVDFPVGITPGSPNQLRFAELMAGNGDALLSYLEAYPLAKGTATDARNAEQLQKELAVFIANIGKPSVVISQKEYDKAQMMAEKIRTSSEIAAEILENGIAEEVMHFVDPATKVPCKVKPDWQNRKHEIIVDLKTTEDSSFEGFQRAVAKYKYYWQPPFYCDGIYTATDGQLNYLPSEFIFLAVEKKPPFQVGLYVLDNEAITLGREQYEKALETFKECQASGNWPAKNIGIQRMGLPKYFTNKFK